MSRELGIDGGRIDCPSCWPPPSPRRGTLLFLPECVWNSGDRSGLEEETTAKFTDHLKMWQHRVNDFTDAHLTLTCKEIHSNIISVLLLRILQSREIAKSAQGLGAGEWWSRI